MKKNYMLLEYTGGAFGFEVTTTLDVNVIVEDEVNNLLSPYDAVAFLQEHGYRTSRQLLKYYEKKNYLRTYRPTFTSRKVLYYADELLHFFENKFNTR